MVNSDVDDNREVKRIQTGIEGLDDLLYGGLPEGSQSLILGSVGTAKSLLVFQILYNNAKQGIPCTFVLIDQKKEDFIKNAASAFTNLKDIDDLINKKLLNVSESKAYDKFTTHKSEMLFIADIVEAVRSNNSKVVALDSIDMIRTLFSDDREFTRVVNYVIENLRVVGVTSAITMELSENVAETNVPGLYGESAFDGIIKLANVVKGDITQHMGSVMKLRYSKYKSMSKLVEITPDGIVMKYVE